MDNYSEDIQRARTAFSKENYTTVLRCLEVIPEGACGEVEGLLLKAKAIQLSDGSLQLALKNAEECLCRALYREPRKEMTSKLSAPRSINSKPLF